MPGELDRIPPPDNSLSVVAAEKAGPEDTLKIVLIVNVALAGVPAADSTSGSVLSTVVAAVIAVCLVVAFLVAQRFPASPSGT